MAGCLAAAVCLFALTAPTESSWTTGTIVNDTNSGSSGALAFRHVGTAGCSAGPAVNATTQCRGSIVPTVPTSADGPVSGTDAITNTGTIGPARLTQTVQTPSCAPVKFDNATSANNPMLARYNTAFQQPDTWGTTSAVGLRGQAFAADVVPTSVGSVLGSNFAVGVWFKVANGYSGGGGLISLGSSPANVASSKPPVAMWMDDSGRIRYSIAGTLGDSSGVSDAAYNDGAWHFAVLSVSSFLVSVPKLYVDNTSKTGVGLTLLGGASGYWHIGWVDKTGLATAPPSATLTGDVSGAFVTTQAVTQGTVSGLRTRSSADAYQQAVLDLRGIQDLWMLGDPGTTTFTGPLPASMSNPCTRVDVAVTFANPADSIARQPLAAFADGTARQVKAPGPGSTQTMTVSLSRGSSYTPAMAGLRLYAPLTVTEKTPTGAWSLRFQWPGAEGAFLA